MEKMIDSYKFPSPELLKKRKIVNIKTCLQTAIDMLKINNRVEGSNVCFLYVKDPAGNC